MKTAIHLALAGALVGACGSVSTGDKPGAPTITTITPDHGPVGGGVQITIAGTGFQAEGGEPLVLVGGHLSTTVTATSDTELTFTLPAGDADGVKVDVEVASQGGFATLADGFRYHARPIVLAISPTIGRSAGGTAITLTGRGFQADDAGVPTIDLGGATATNVQIVSDTQITATTGAAAPGTAAFTPRDVSFTNANGSHTLATAFSVTAPGMLAIERGEGQSRIFHVDLTTKRVSTVTAAERKLIGCAVSPSGVLFSTTGQSSGNTPHQLVTVDPLTGAVTVIGPLITPDNVPHGISALAFIANTLYGTDSGCCAATQHLVSIDPATGRVTILGSQAPLTNGNAIAAKDGASLWYANNSGGALFSLDVASSGLAPGPALTGSIQPNTVQGMVQIADVLYLGERSFPSTILTVDKNTGVMTPFASMPVTINGLCPTPANF
ncbi:MAG: IPT/TIG domain-containing protein [Deltaproteobacteria bacterium]|nr:IPT/TIG domain-containing protein [Deltaproteobacteria bacterium]